jgi:hypothetical protein
MRQDELQADEGRAECHVPGDDGQGVEARSPPTITARTMIVP